MHFIFRSLILFIYFISLNSHADPIVSYCENVFVNGATSHDAVGVIKYENSPVIYSDSSGILASNALDQKGSATFICDGFGTCSSSGTPTSTLDLGGFVESSNKSDLLTVTLNVTIGGSGSNNFGVINLDDGGTLNFSSDFNQYFIEELNILDSKTGSATLNLIPGDYYIGELETYADTTINIIGTGDVRIFLRDHSDLEGNTRVNIGGSPENILFYGYDTFHIKNTSEIYALVYSQTKAELKDSVSLRGAISAGIELKLKGSSTIHYQCNTSVTLPTPIVDYHFDECSYTGSGFEVIDQLGNYSATAYGQVTTAKLGQVERFVDMSDESHHIETSIPLPAVFSVSTWFKKPTSTSGNRYFILGAMESGGDLLYLDRNDDWVWGVYSLDTGAKKGTYSFASLNNNWHHMVLVYEGNQTKLYIDGVLEDSVNKAPSGTLKYIGTSFDEVNTNNPQSFRSPLDEFIIFNQALSSTDIRTIFDNQSQQKNYDGSTRAPVSCLVPIAEYRFDEVSYNDVPGEIIESISGLNGQAKSSQPTSGKVCNAIDLSPTGTNDYAILSKDILSSTTDFTVSLWAKTSKTGSQSILSGANSGSNNELIMWFSNAASFRPYLKNRQNGSVAITTIADDNWHHLVWTREGSQSCLYRDKVLQGCRTQSMSTLNIASLILGQEQDNVGGGFSSSQAFDGLIDELIVFDRAISADAIATVYDNQDAGNGYDGSARTCAVFSPPVLDMRFDENDWNVANSILDSSGNGFHASATNVSPATGLICNAADMTATGIDDYITLNNQSLDGRSSFTISLWYKTAKSSNQSIISGSNISSMNELIMWFNSGTKFGPYISGSTQTINIDSIADNAWHHAVWTRSGTNNLFYRDGVLQAGKATLPSGALDISSLILGQEQDSIGGSFDAGQAVDGLVDELLIFSQALPSSEILDIFNNQSNGLNYDGTVRAGCLPLIDHFEIIHDGNGLTCEAEAITIKACANADCSALYTTAVDVQLSVNGIANKTITVLNGSTDTTFVYTQANTATLSLDETFECVNGASSGCGVTFADTGFRFYANDVGTSIPTQLSGKFSNIGFNASTLKLQAIETNPETGACQAVFIDDVTIEVSATCIDPVACSGQQVVINNLSSNITINTLDANTALTYTNIDLGFGNNTQNTALFNLSYPDAGQIQLHARYNIPDENGNLTGNYMLGSSNVFVVRPFGFYVELPNNATATTHLGSVFKKAGEGFDVSLTAVQWQSADDSNNDGVPDSSANLSDNLITTNFGAEVLSVSANISHSLVLPSGGNLGSLTNNSFSNFSNGKASVSNMNYSEVGIIDFTANLVDHSYLGASDIVGNVTNIGRFIPDHFDLSIDKEGSFVAVCDGISVDMPFAYSGQMSIDNPTKGSLSYLEKPAFLITPKSQQGTHTLNYSGDFNKLLLSGVNRFMVDDGTGALVSSPAKDASQLGVDNTNYVRLTSNYFDGSLAELILTQPAVLKFEYSALDHFVYKHEENSEIIPFTADINLAIASVVDIDGVSAEDYDGNGDTGTASDTVITLDPSGKEIRFGRAYLANSFGPETSPIPQTLQVQYLSSVNESVYHYEPVIDDICTAFDSVNINLTTLTLDKNKTGVNIASGQFISGETQSIKLNAAGIGNRGKVGVEYDIYPWLEYYWDWDGSSTKILNNNPRAVATFGIFRGNDRIIYQREVTN